MLLSIIVPVYNMAAEDKLKHCLDSLLAQTIEDYEVIAVDDASTDNSLAILREYEARYPKLIRVIALKENHRQGGAKNAGMSEAVGDWIGFIDSDDWIHPSMYEKLLQRARDTEADLVGCDYAIVTGYKECQELQKKDLQVVVNNTSEQTGILDMEKHKKLILRPGSMVVKIYKRQVITANDLSFPEHMFYEDNCAAALWSFYFTHFERVDEPLYYYLTVPSSTTHHVTWEKCQDRMKAAKLLFVESRKRGLYEKYQKEIDFRVTELYYVTTLFSYMYSGKNQKLHNTNTLKKEMISMVPEFYCNPYYENLIAKEDQKFIRIQRKSNLCFFLYYKLLFTYRNIKKKKRK